MLKYIHLFILLDIKNKNSIICISFHCDDNDDVGKCNRAHSITCFTISTSLVQLFSPIIILVQKLCT